MLRKFSSFIEIFHLHFEGYKSLYIYNLFFFLFHFSWMSSSLLQSYDPPPTRHPRKNIKFHGKFFHNFSVFFFHRRRPLSLSIEPFSFYQSIKKSYKMLISLFTSTSLTQREIIDNTHGFFQELNLSNFLCFVTFESWELNANWRKSDSQLIILASCNSCFTGLLEKKNDLTKIFH